MKVAEISGVLFASCSNAPKRGKKCDEFKSLHQNILKLLFCGHISLLLRKTRSLQIPPHMGKRYAIWWRSPIGSALFRVRQPICSEHSAMATYLFHHSGLKHYSTIRLLTLRVKFDGIWQSTPELKHLPRTAFIRCNWNILFPIKAPFAKKCSSSDLWIFCLLSSTKPVPMYLVTCWKYKQIHIFISPCRNDPSQLQNCRSRRFFTVFGTLLVTWRQRKEILSPAHPKAEKVLSFFASSNVSFGLIREALHCFNGCAKIWSAPGMYVYYIIPGRLFQEVRQSGRWRHHGVSGRKGESVCVLPFDGLGPAGRD